LARFVQLQNLPPRERTENLAGGQKRKKMSYNFKDFDAQFPDDAACLHHIFLARFANHVCECGKSGCFFSAGGGQVEGG